MMKYVKFSIILVLLGGMHPAAPAAGPAVETETVYLSGRGIDDAVEWDFYCTGGRNSGHWTTIPVPSNWELHGFGTYNYGHHRDKASEQGRYRTSFTLAPAWTGKRIDLVFEGVMTDTEVFVNGRSAGPKHQGGFYRFTYDITDWVTFDGENLLEVMVSKVSSDSSVEQAERQADWWVFGGIYRPVYLRAVPTEHIRRVAIEAKADGRFAADVYLDGIEGADHLKGEILDPSGNLYASLSAAVKKGQPKALLTAKLVNPRAWTAETPSLYWLQADLYRGDTIIHRVNERFGFRTIEVVQGKGIFVNDRRVMIKGVNRHSFWPDSGRALSRRICYEDVKLIKSMNMNAVRSHYPADKAFLEVCDELGLYVIGELAGWQKPPYDTGIGRTLLEAMVRRDVNHPSILFWANGNEGGWNTELDGDFAIHDLQNRPVLHPWEKFSGIDTDHYETYESTRQKLEGPLIFMPTEFLHGLYDGGHGAGLEDYWNLMSRSPYGGGGFLWALLDEGVVRTDQDGKIDVAGNWAPDGIVGPYRQKEGSYYTIQQIWSPIQIEAQLPEAGNQVSISVANQYSFTNADQTRFIWQLVRFPSAFSGRDGHVVERTGSAAGPNIKPGQSGRFELVIDENWGDYDALYITVQDAAGQDLWTWSLPIQSRRAFAQSGKSGASERPEYSVEGDRIVVSAGHYQYAFDKTNGLLLQVIRDGKIIPLSNGPRVVFGTDDASYQADVGPARVAYSRDDDTVVIRAQNSGGLEQFTWTVQPTGELTLAYQFTLGQDNYDHFGMAYDHFGIAFDCPEADMEGMRWLGSGPHRVWKNRLKGGRLDVWQRDAKRVVPGLSWDYPLFAGYYGDFYWLDVRTKNGSVRVFNPTEGLYFRIGELLNGEKPVKEATLSPQGDLSFMHAISPIGTKFLRASELGPAGQPTVADGSYAGELVFVF